MKNLEMTFKQKIVKMLKIIIFTTFFRGIGVLI